MARVIPSGTTDYTTQIAMREAAANDALARLYITLAQRREERKAQQEFMKEMLGLKHGYTEQLYDKYGAPGARAGGGYNSSIPPGRVYTPPAEDDEDDDSGGASLRSDTGTGKSAPVPGDNASTALASADDGDVDIPAKAQLVQHQGGSILNPNRPVRTTGGGSNAVKKEGFTYIGPKTLAAWEAAEKKYNLPRGILMTTLGLENAGGYQLGANPRSKGGARGLFQHIDETLTDYGVPLSARKDAAAMGDLTAQVYARGVANIEKAIGRKLDPTDPRDTTLIYMTHHFGTKGGTDIARAYDKAQKFGSDVFMGKIIPADVLARNGYSSATTVKEFIDKVQAPRVVRWNDRAQAYMVNPPADPSTIPHNTTGVAEGSPAATGARPPVGANWAGRGEGAGYRFGDAAKMIRVPLPDGSGRTVVVHEDVAPVAYEALKRLHKAGAPLDSISGYVPRNIRGSRTPSQHGFGFAIDLNQTGRDKVSPAFLAWHQRNPGVLSKILADLQIRSGGDWRNPDFGHLEFFGGSIQAYNNYLAQRKAARQAKKDAATNLAKVEPPQDAFGSLPTDKPKAAPLPMPSPVPTAQDKTLAPQVAGTTAAPSSAPQPAIKNIPPEVGGATATPTPQTDQPVEQKTQAVPAPTPQQVQQDSGYTADDMDERAATRLSGENVPLPPSRPTAEEQEQYQSGPGAGTRRFLQGADRVATDIGTAVGDIGSDILWGAGDIASRIGNAARTGIPVGTLLADNEPPPPLTDEAGFTDNNLTPLAEPGDAARGIVSGANDVIQRIREKAAEYNKLAASRNESRQLEQVYNYPQGQQPTTLSMPNMPSFDRGFLDPAKDKAMMDEVMRRRIASAPQPEQEAPPDPNDFRDPRNIQKAQEILMRRRMQDAETQALGQMYNYPQAQTATPAPTPTPQQPLPVPASTVAEAMYDMGNEGMPTVPYPPPTIGMPNISWPKSAPAAPKVAAPPPAVKTLPSGKPYIIPTEVPQGAATAKPITTAPTARPNSRVIQTIDPNTGELLFKPAPVEEQTDAE